MKWRYSTVGFFLQGDILSLLQVLHDNWWSGNFVLQMYSCDFWDRGDILSMDENCFGIWLDDSNLLIFDRHTMNLKHASAILKLNTLRDNWVKIFYHLQIINAPECKFTCLKMKSGIIMCGIIGMIQVYDSNTGKQVLD